MLKQLLAAGADKSVKNNAGHTAFDVAKAYDKPHVQALLTGSKL